MPELTNWYQVFYDTINNYLFGGEIVENTYPDLMAHLFSMIVTCFVVAVPIIIIVLSIKLVYKAFDNFF